MGFADVISQLLGFAAGLNNVLTLVFGVCIVFIWSRLSFTHVCACHKILLGWLAKRAAAKETPKTDAKETRAIGMTEIVSSLQSAAASTAGGASMDASIEQTRVRLSTSHTQQLALEIPSSPTPAAPASTSIYDSQSTCSTSTSALAVPVSVAPESAAVPQHAAFSAAPPPPPPPPPMGSNMASSTTFMSASANVAP